MNNETEAAVMFFVVAAILLFDCIQTLIQVAQNGIFKSQRQILMEKTKLELKQMLKGVRGISRLNKVELVELIIA